MPVRQQQAGPSRLPFNLALLVAFVGGPVALWAHLPGLGLTAVALTIAGAVHPSPLLTGSQGTGASRKAVPATPAEKRALSRHTRLKALRTIPLPIGLWPVRVCALAGAGAGLAAHGLAVVPPNGWPTWLASWGPWVNAVGTAMLVTGVGRIWRTTLSADEPGPGILLIRVGEAPRWGFGLVLLGSAAGWVAASAIASAARPWIAGVAQVYFGGALMGAAFAIWALCRRSSWEGWYQRERGRRQWEPRWVMMPKEEQPPALVDRLVDGPLTVDTFRPRPGRDLAYYVKASGQLASAVGDSSIVRVLPAPDTDSAGAPIPGTSSSSLFRVAVLSANADIDEVTDTNLLATFQWAGRWAQVPKMTPAPVLVERKNIGPYTVDLFDAPGKPTTEMLRMSDKIAVGVGAGTSAVVIPEHEDGAPGSIHPTRFRVAACDPETRVDVATASAEEVAVCLERFLTEAADYLHQDVATLCGLELLTAQGPQVWRINIAGDVGQLAGLMEQIAPTLLDDTAVILGRTEDVFWKDALMTERVRTLKMAGEWGAHFREVIKMGDTPPVPQLAHLDELDVGGVVLHRLPFASPQGKDIARDYLPLGQRLRTTMPQAPFLLVTAIAPTEGASAPGARSDKFFEVVWSEYPVAPGPAELPPSRNSPSRSRIDSRDGPALVLAGMVDHAFRSVFKGDRVPQTVDAECLTVSAPWIWRVRLRLYGGLSLIDLRAKADKLSALMRAEWIRLRSKGELVDIFVGAHPVSATVAEEYRRTVAELDFEQAWVSARTVTSAGEVPAMMSLEPLETGSAVTVYTFALPAGLSSADVKEGLDKVASTTRAGFLRIVSQPDPSRVVLMSARENPIPTRAAYDFAAADSLVAETEGSGTALRIPWGTGVDGRPVVWEVGGTPHVLVLGITGTGKSVALLTAIYATLLAGWDVAVIDPVKDGADFAALAPWLRGLGGRHIAQAEAMMRSVYAEVDRRKALAADHGVSGIDQLPSEVRPPHMLVVIDEFTSLMLVETVRKTKTTDPDVLAGYERTERENAQRASIGSLVSRVAREARSAGVHLMLGTQVLKADTIAKIPGGDLKNNLGRMLLGMSTPGERMSGLRQPELAPALVQAPIGRGVWEAQTSSAIEVQTWFATADEYAAQLAGRDILPRDDWDVNAFMPKEESAAYAEVEIVETNDVEMLDEIVLDDLGESEQPPVCPPQNGAPAGPAVTQEVVTPTGTVLWEAEEF